MRPLRTVEKENRVRVLIAEDELFYRCLLEGTLREWGYDVVAVSDGAAAWEALRRPDAPKLAVLDWQMPGLDGLEVCRRVRAAASPEPTYVIMLTAREGRANTLSALRAGADDFVTKPFDREELQVRLQAGARVVGLQTSLAVIFSFARAVEAKCPYTHGHAERVTSYALRLATQVGISDAERVVLQQGAILHDIGKIAVPDSILSKAGPLTPEEFAIMKGHPTEGVRIISPLQSINAVIPLVRWHHERPNGSGYPDGLRGEEIPYLVRILSVADVYDALRSARPYRAALSQAECFAILNQEAARGGLDAELVCQFVQALAEPCDQESPPIAPTESLAAQQGSRASIPRVLLRTP
jgi:putative two-component system response regulator